VHEAPQETAAPTEAEPILQDGPADADVAGQPQDADVAVDEPVEPERELAEETPTDLVAELAATKQALAERTTDLQRLQAEYVNYKRRVDRDRELVRQNATFQVLTGLLPVLDDIDRAREHGELEGGFKAVADSLERTVAGLGLEKYGEPGDEFDPNLHEALMHSHSPDVTTTTCQTIVHAGYRIGDRVVRPARVTVVDPEPAEDA
jgi:molecular chaperone GrpE